MMPHFSIVHQQCDQKYSGKAVIKKVDVVSGATYSSNGIIKAVKMR